MITPRKRTVTVVRHEYLIPAPATQRDVSDTIVQAGQDMKAIGLDPSYDDVILVEGHDYEVLVYWVERGQD